MYHDQGLPVLKFAGFEQAVNITLGLPYPRVAVDHGTALELAGKGIASDGLFVASCALMPDIGDCGQQHMSHFKAPPKKNLGQHFLHR